VRAWLSENSDVHDIATSPSALQDSANPIEGAVDNLEKIYDIGKMIAPTVMFFDEGDSLAPKRSASGGSPSDKLTNKFLNLIDGEQPLHKVFTALTTNRLDILDPALIRSKRLKVMEITGRMKTDDVTQIVANTLKGIPLSDDLSIEKIVDSAKNICNTPADYAAFVEKARSLRDTEFEVLQRFRALAEAEEDIKLNFIKFNFKTLVGILEAVRFPQVERKRLRERPDAFSGQLPGGHRWAGAYLRPDSYPMMSSHLRSARKEISQSPVKKGKVQLDEFLEAELSQEPQVGFIIGVGANDVSGMLLPIATSLNYKMSAETVLVTGAVVLQLAGGSRAGNGGENDAAVRPGGAHHGEKLPAGAACQGQRGPASGGIFGKLYLASPVAVRFLQCRRPVGRLCPGTQHPFRAVQDSHLSRFRYYRSSLDQGGEKRRGGRIGDHRRTPQENRESPAPPAPDVHAPEKLLRSRQGVSGKLLAAEQGYPGRYPFR
jgi:hypothetical protein